MSAVSPQWRWASCALLLGAASAASGQPSELLEPRGEIVDRVVAVVRSARSGAANPAETVITRSDLAFEAAIVFIQRGRVQMATEEVGEEALASALEYAIAQRLHAQEAEKLRVFAVQPHEIDVAEAELANQLGSAQALERFLERHDRARADLRRVLERSLRAARTLDSRIRLRAQVGESEVQRYYDRMMEQAQREQADVMPGPYAQVRTSLREKLFRERYNALAKSETAQLRDQADVRVLVSFESSPEAP